MEIKVNDELTIYCDFEISYACGNAYHVVEIWQGMNCLLDKHIHCCESGYEAIFYALSQIDKDNLDLYPIKEQLVEVVNNHYLCYGEN